MHAADSGNNLERKLKKTRRTKTKLAPSGKYGKITFREHGQFPLKLRTVIAEFTNFGQSGRFERDTCEFSLAKINLSMNLTKHPISFSRLFAFQNNLSANFNKLSLFPSFLLSSLFPSCGRYCPIFYFTCIPRDFLI